MFGRIEYAAPGDQQQPTGTGGAQKPDVMERIKKGGGRSVFPMPKQPTSKTPTEASSTPRRSPTPEPSQPLSRKGSSTDFSRVESGRQSPITEQSIPKCLMIDAQKSKYSPFVNEVLGSKTDSLKVGSAMEMWNEIKQHVLSGGEEPAITAVEQLAAALKDINIKQNGDPAAYRGAIVYVGGKKLWAAVEEKMKEKPNA